jgi:hypothetical protein
MVDAQPLRFQLIQLPKIIQIHTKAAGNELLGARPDPLAAPLQPQPGAAKVSKGAS